MLDSAIDFVKKFLKSPYKNQSLFHNKVGLCQEFSRTLHHILPKNFLLLNKRGNGKAADDIFSLSFCSGDPQKSLQKSGIVLS